MSMELCLDKRDGAVCKLPKGHDDPARTAEERLHCSIPELLKLKICPKHGRLVNERSGGCVECRD